MHSHCLPRSWSTSPSAALGLECIAPSLGAADGGLRHPAEVNSAVEVGVAAHVDAAPQRGVVARGAAPGAARLAGAHEDLDVVEPAEDGGDRVQRQRRPVPRLLRLAAAVAAAAAAAPGGGGRGRGGRRRHRVTGLGLGWARVRGSGARSGVQLAREGGGQRQPRRRCVSGTHRVLDHLRMRRRRRSLVAAAAAAAASGGGGRHLGLWV